jgi:hypothetical protein
MPRHEKLNNIAHKNLRVLNHFGAEFGDNVGRVLTFPTEYQDMQREYPIFFRKDAATGEYQSVALLGFEKNENLFLEGNRWDAHYVPGIIARGPFLIGFEEQEIDGEMRKQAVVHVDVDSPRVSQTTGIPVFAPQGGNSAYLEQTINVLRGITAGLDMSKAMFAAFVAHDLIEPVQIEVKPTPEQTYSLTGLHTINHQKLGALNGAALEQLNKAGFLQGAYLVLASLGNVHKLIARKQRRLPPSS